MVESLNKTDANYDDSQPNKIQLRENDGATTQAADGRPSEVNGYTAQPAYGIQIPEGIAHPAYGVSIPEFPIGDSQPAYGVSVPEMHIAQPVMPEYESIPDTGISGGSSNLIGGVAAGIAAGVGTLLVGNKLRKINEDEE